MHARFLFRFVLTLILLVILPAFAAAGTVHYIHDDLTSSLYQDDAATTASWDTTTGTIRSYADAPAISGTLPGGPANDVAVRNHVACVADAGGLRIVDTSNPATPTTVGTYGLPFPATGVALRGNIAYVTDGPNGIHSIDVSNPAAPFQRS